MKNLTYFLILFSILQSCRKYDNKPSVLTNGDGVWQINQIEYIYFDTLSNIDSTLTYTSNLGELLFLESNWGPGPIHISKHIYTDTSGNVTTSNLELMTDGNRLDLIGTTPVGIEGMYSVDKWGRKNQKWVSFLHDTTNTNGIISVMKTVTVKKGKS